MSCRVYQDIDGYRIVIESDKGRVKVAWEECEALSTRIMLLKQAHDYVTHVEHINDHVTPLSRRPHPDDTDASAAAHRKT